MVAVNHSDWIDFTVIRGVMEDVLDAFGIKEQRAREISELKHRLVQLEYLKLHLEKRLAEAIQYPPVSVNPEPPVGTLIQTGPSLILHAHEGVNGWNSSRMGEEPWHPGHTWFVLHRWCQDVRTYVLFSPEWLTW